MTKALRDLSGRRFGSLVAIDVDKTHIGPAYWICQCDCGVTKSIARRALLYGTTSTCGCGRRGTPIKHDLTGQKRNFLTAVAFAERRNKQTYWDFLCDCGNKTRITRQAFLSGQIKSCGCYRADPIRIQELTELKRSQRDCRAPIVRSAYSSYSCAAERRGLIFDLTLTDFDLLTSQQCFYCGATPVERQRYGGTAWLNGIDRSDNSVGYTLQNCVPCCWQCNRAKGVMSSDEFLEWVSRIAGCHRKAA